MWLGGLWGSSASTTPRHHVVEMLLLLRYLTLLLHGLQLLAQGGHLLLDGGGGKGRLLWRLLGWGDDGETKDVETTGGAGLLPLEPGPGHTYQGYSKRDEVRIITSDPQ